MLLLITRHCQKTLAYSNKYTDKGNNSSHCKKNYETCTIFLNSTYVLHAV